MSTLGNTDTGGDGTTTSWGVDYGFAIKVTAPGDIDVTDLNTRLRAGVFQGSGKGVIWLVSDGSVHAVGGTFSMGGSTPAWYVSTFTSTSLSDGVEYWIGYVTTAPGAGYGGQVYSTTTAYNSVDNTNSYSSPNSFSGWNYQRLHSIYINYPGGETGPSLEVEGITPGSAETVDWVNVATIL